MQFSELPKYKLQQYKKTNDRDTNYRITNMQHTERQKPKIQKYKNINYRIKEINVNKNIPKFPSLAKSTLRSNNGERYLKVQGWKKYLKV